jgi:hypothetical protein
MSGEPDLEQVSVHRFVEIARRRWPDADRERLRIYVMGATTRTECPLAVHVDECVALVQHGSPRSESSVYSTADHCGCGST